MDSLMKAIDNYQVAPSNEQIDEGLFLQYMNKLPIWDYFGVSREVYLAFSDTDKRAKINSYYYDMKSRSSILFFSRKMSELVGFIETRDSLLSKVKQAIEYVSEVCFYCGKCRECIITSQLQREVNRKGLKTFNKDVKWWIIDCMFLSCHVRVSE